jgi:UDP-glucose 4-epimerase
MYSTRTDRSNIIPQKILLIGGNGFIGSWVVDQLIRDGHIVTVFDLTLDDPKYTEKPYAEISGDFLNLGDLAYAIKNQDSVVHMVSTTNPASAEADPLLDIRTNVVGTVELLRLAVEENISHFYYASSGGAVYGAAANGDVTEDHAANPVSPYGIGKFTIERYLDYFHTLHGLDSTIFRLSNPYGPRQPARRRQGVIPIFLRAIAEGNPITVHGDGTMVRDYIYVEDMAKMISNIIGLPHRGQIYNIASGSPYSITDIIKIINQVTGITPRIKYTSTPATFVERISLSNKRYSDEFETSSELTSLTDGIRRTWSDILKKEDSVDAGSLVRWSDVE